MHIDEAMHANALMFQSVMPLPGMTTDAAQPGATPFGQTKSTVRLSGSPGATKGKGLATVAIVTMRQSVLVLTPVQQHLGWLAQSNAQQHGAQHQIVVFWSIEVPIALELAPDVTMRHQGRVRQGTFDVAGMANLPVFCESVEPSLITPVAFADGVGASAQIDEANTRCAQLCTGIAFKVGQLFLKPFGIGEVIIVHAGYPGCSGLGKTRVQGADDSGLRTRYQPDTPVGRQQCCQAGHISLSYQQQFQ